MRIAYRAFCLIETTSLILILMGMHMLKYIGIYCVAVYCVLLFCTYNRNVERDFVVLRKGVYKTKWLNIKQMFK